MDFAASRSLNKINKKQRKGIIHKRCGHRGSELLKFMSRCECYVENGFRIEESEFDGDECLCEACTLAKMNKRQN